jgi:type II secretory pathway component GspD/PulD (secretin)
MEEKRTVKIYPLKYAKAADVESRLKGRLDNKKVGSVTSDDRTNSVIVETLPDRILEIDSLVSSLDTKTREVLIDAKIVKVTLSNGLAAEIQWEGLYKQFLHKSEFFLGNHSFAPLARTGKSFVDDFVAITPTTTPAQGGKNILTENLVFGAIGEDTFEALVNFLRTIGETKILSNPKIAVISNQEARILVGEKQAYVTTTTTTSSGGGSTVAENVTFIDVGIQLNVTPVVNEDGFVTMKIKPEVSSVSTSLVTPSGNKIPILETSVAETTVMVRDGVSIMIGGLRRDEKTENRQKVPLLGDIPILGVPFNSFTNSTRHTELLILITPHIVYGNTLATGEQRVGDRRFKSYSDYAKTVDMKRVRISKVKMAPLNLNKNETVKNVAVQS